MFQEPCYTWLTHRCYGFQDQQKSKVWYAQNTLHGEKNHLMASKALLIITARWEQVPLFDSFIAVSALLRLDRASICRHCDNGWTFTIKDCSIIAPTPCGITRLLSRACGFHSSPMRCLHVPLCLWKTRFFATKEQKLTTDIRTRHVICVNVNVQYLIRQKILLSKLGKRANFPLVTTTTHN